VISFNRMDAMVRQFQTLKLGPICHTLLVVPVSAMTRNRPSGDWIAPRISGLPANQQNGLVFDWSGQAPSGWQFGSNGGAALMPWELQFGAQLMHKSLQMGSFSTNECILGESNQM
jgi:hypothetical protein